MLFWKEFIISNTYRQVATINSMDMHSKFTINSVVLCVYLHPNDYLIILLPMLLSTPFFAIVTLSEISASSYASTLSKEGPSLIDEAGSLNQTADEMDIDVAIDPTESLPPNGTQQISTEGATDIDINNIPPTGVTVVIENETVYVTNRPVTIG